MLKDGNLRFKIGATILIYGIGIGGALILSVYVRLPQ